jgi:hypothetical protein
MNIKCTSKADTCSADRTCRNLNNEIHCHVRSLHTALHRLHKNSSFSEVFVSKHIVADVTTPQIWSFLLSVHSYEKNKEMYFTDS